MNKKPHLNRLLEQMSCKNISSYLFLKMIQEHFANEITFSNLAGKVLPHKVHTDTTHSSVTPAWTPELCVLQQTTWITLAVFTNLCRKNMFPVLLLFRFLISEISDLLMRLFKFKMHINIPGRRKQVMHYQIPVLFMSKTNTRRVHTEMRWILHRRVRRKVNYL